jgi:aspartate ammonia-lyase
MKKTRREIDALGPVEVPVDSYGGSFATRARENFQISSLQAPASFQAGLAMVKMAAAEVNAELGHLPKKHAKAIVKAAEEFMDGNFDADFDLDVYQAGAGTPYNMALNEILANRANELLGGKKGDYSPIHPNNHVNMAQSSNDVIPTAIRLAALMDLAPVLQEGEALVKSLEKKAKQFGKVLKVGRTHLQEAVPVTLGQEFQAYADSLDRALERLEASGMELADIGIGATAVGTGINTHPQFAKKMCENLSKRLGLRLRRMNPFESNHSMAAFLAVSAALRGFSTELLRICNDLRLMAGPLQEIQLPEVEPGSSIMPGKVNPSVLECMSMICVQVFAMDHAVAISAQQGQLELNWYTPLIMLDLLHAQEILGNGLYMLRTECVDGIEANEVQMKSTLENSVAVATALAPVLGYHAVAELVKESKKKKMPFVSVVPAEYKKYLNAAQLTQPNRK